MLLYVLYIMYATVCMFSLTIFYKWPCMHFKVYKFWNAGKKWFESKRDEEKKKKAVYEFCQASQPKICWFAP